MLSRGPTHLAKPTPTPAIRPDAGGHRFGPNLHCGECGRSWNDHQCEPAPCEHAKDVAKQTAPNRVQHGAKNVARVKLAEAPSEAVAANEPIAKVAPSSDADRAAESPAKTVLKPVRPASWIAAKSKDSQD